MDTGLIKSYPYTRVIRFREEIPHELSGSTCLKPDDSFVIKRRGDSNSKLSFRKQFCLQNTNIWRSIQIFDIDSGRDTKIMYPDGFVPKWLESKRSRRDYYLTNCHD